MNTQDVVASEVTAPAASEVVALAASEATGPAAGEESVGVGPAGRDGLSVATPAGSAAAGVQLGLLTSSKMMLASNGTPVEIRSGDKNTFCRPPGFGR